MRRGEVGKVRKGGGGYVSANGGGSRGREGN